MEKRAEPRVSSRGGKDKATMAAEDLADEPVQIKFPPEEEAVRDRNTGVHDSLGILRSSLHYRY